MTDRLNLLVSDSRTVPHSTYLHKGIIIRGRMAEHHPVENWSHFLLNYHLFIFSSNVDEND